MPEKTSFESFCDLAMNPLGLMFVIFPIIVLFCGFFALVIEPICIIVGVVCAPILVILSKLGLYNIDDDDDDDDD